MADLTDRELEAQQVVISALMWGHPEAARLVGRYRADQFCDEWHALAYAEACRLFMIWGFASPADIEEVLTDHPDHETYGMAQLADLLDCDRSDVDWAVSVFDRVPASTVH